MNNRMTTKNVKAFFDMLGKLASKNHGAKITYKVRKKQRRL